MKKVAYVDPKNPGIVRFYGSDEFDGVLAGTRAQMIADALNAAPPEEQRILDEREVKALAKKCQLPKYMWDTDTATLALAHFANEASRFMNKEQV